MTLRLRSFLSCAFNVPATFRQQGHPEQVSSLLRWKNIPTHIHAEGPIESPIPLCPQSMCLDCEGKPEDVHKRHKLYQEPSCCEVTTVPPLGFDDIFIKILNVTVSQKSISIWFSQQGTKKKVFWMFFIVLFALLLTKGSTCINSTWFNFNPAFRETKLWLWANCSESLVTNRKSACSHTCVTERAGFAVHERWATWIWRYGHPRRQLSPKGLNPFTAPREHDQTASSLLSAPVYQPSTSVPAVPWCLSWLC